MWRDEVDEASRWTQEHELLAALVEHIGFWGRLQLMAAGVKGSALPKPTRIRRPGAEPAAAADASDGDKLARFFGKHVH